jgi:radical SAM superfamily enzyme YgiQ (UPF0313 family)
MKILLVSLYDIHNGGMRTIHSVLKNKGHNVKSVFFKSSSYTSLPYTKTEVNALADEIVERKPEMVGFSVKTPHFNLFKMLSSKIRNYVGAIIIGGPHATVSPESCLEHADYVCVGEGEDQVSQIENLDNTAGIYPNIPYSQNQNIDDLPLPYYGDDCLYRFCTDFHKSDLHNKKMSVTSGRNCFFSCAFCHENTLRKNVYTNYFVRRKKVDTTIEEIKRYKTLFPYVEEIVFSDCVFTHNIDWIEEFSGKFLEVGLKFRCFGHAEKLTKEMLTALKRANLNWISFGVQSGSDTAKGIYNRKESKEKVLQISQWCRELGIIPRWDFIVNSPYERGKDFRDTQNFIEKLQKPCVVREFGLRFFPGSEITNRAIADGFITKSQIEGNVDKFGDWSHNYHLHG